MDFGTQSYSMRHNEADMATTTTPLPTPKLDAKQLAKGVQLNIPHLKDRAMLVQLTVRQWTARKHDKRITNEVAEREKASADVGRYNKRLLPKEALKFMQAKASAVRAEHYKRTLPWTDDGPRILSSAGYFEYARIIDDIRADFNKAADDFVKKYPEFRDAAARELGQLHVESDYPDVSEIRGKFKIETRFTPLPSQEDFRVRLPDAVQAQIRDDISQQLVEAMERGQRDIFERASLSLTHMVEKLRNYQPAYGDQKAKGIFRDSLVGNIRELVQLIPTLNVADAPEVANLQAELDNLTADLTPASLREDDKLRNATADEAAAILAKVADFLA